MKVGIYVRVSTLQQTTDNQLLDLYEVCERNDWTVVEEYNETISGTKGATDRKELNRMLKDASRKKFDKLVVWSVDRVGRSMKHLVGVLSQLQDLDIDIYSYKQGIDTSTTMGSSFFHMVGIFAELEITYDLNGRRLVSKEQWHRESSLEERMLLMRMLSIKSIS